jgi:hypothetical protein
MTLVERINALATRIATEVKSKLNVSAKASAADLATGTDDAKYVTALGLRTDETARIHVGTSAPTDTTKLWFDTN